MVGNEVNSVERDESSAIAHCLTRISPDRRLRSQHTSIYIYDLDTAAVSSEQFLATKLAKLPEHILNSSFESITRLPFVGYISKLPPLPFRIIHMILWEFRIPTILIS